MKTMMEMVTTARAMGVLTAGARKGKRKTLRPVTCPETASGPSVSNEVYKCNREGTSSQRITFNVAQLRRKTRGEVRRWLRRAGAREIVGKGTRGNFTAFIKLN